MTNDCLSAGTKSLGTHLAVGIHLIAEFHGCFCELDNADFIQKTLVESALASGARVLSTKMHSFGDFLGVTGVVLLAESHISIHTWPEFKYAAVDVFTCGRNANPQLAIDYLKKAFSAQDVKTAKVLRGMADGQIDMARADN